MKKWKNILITNYSIICDNQGSYIEEGYPYLLINDLKKFYIKLNNFWTSLK